jgi:hypothetical protein
MGKSVRKVHLATGVEPGYWTLCRSPEKGGRAAMTLEKVTCPSCLNRAASFKQATKNNRKKQSAF